MPELQLADLGTALPELFLAVMSMVLLLYGAYRGNRGTGEVIAATCIVFVIALLLLAFADEGAKVAFNGLFVVDAFAVFLKVMILVGAGLGLVISYRYLKAEGLLRFEYPILTLLAVLGMMMMVSANDLISLYIGLEVQSLALYVMAAFHRDTVRSTEAGLKYFVLGALSSGMLLYGCSMVYGFAGSTGFDTIAAVLGEGSQADLIGIIVGIVFLAAGLAFKVSAVPFHMWTPDVYEGAPTPVTAFFAVAPKIAAIGLFLRVLVEPFGDLVAQWQQIIIAISIMSMVLGAFAALAQHNIKRLMAYSSIGHIGFALVGLAAATPEGVASVLIYMAIYLAMNVGTFACILCMRRKGRAVESIDDLAGLARHQRGMALALTIFMFSMAGIPPLAGFLGKFFVFRAAIEAELYTLAVIGVLASVVSAFYYLRIVKLIWFDEAVEPLEQPIGGTLATVMLVTAIVTALFIVYPAPLMDGAEIAARSLY